MQRGSLVVIKSISPGSHFEGSSHHLGNTARLIRGDRLKRFGKARAISLRGVCISSALGRH